MISRKLLIMRSCHSQTLSPEKVMGTEVTQAFGPFNIYCSLGLLGANMVMVDGQSQHPRGYPLWGTSQMVKPEGLFCQQIYPWTSWSPHLHSMVCYSLGYGSLAFLNCHRVSGKVGQFSNPHTCSGE